MIGSLTSSRTQAGVTSFLRLACHLVTVAEIQFSRREATSVTVGPRHRLRSCDSRAQTAPVIESR